MKKHFFTPQSHVFLWDLHEVVLEKSLSHWFMICLKFPHKWEIIKNLDRKTVRILITFIAEYLGLTKKQMVLQELLNAAKEAKNTALSNLAIDICTSYIPIAKTVTIIEKLSTLGYKHYVCSNIGKIVFDRCSKKFHHLFSFFKGFIIPFQSSHSNAIIKKPQREFFTTFLTTYNFQPQEIIFIDDKLPNVEAAQSVGMFAIQFKSSDDLTRELKRLQIFEKD